MAVHPQKQGKKGRREILASTGGHLCLFMQLEEQHTENCPAGPSTLTHTLGDAWATLKITWLIKVTFFFPFILYSVKFFNFMLCKKWTLTARPCFIPTAQLPPWELFPKWCNYLSSFPSHRLNLQSLHINFVQFSLRLAAKTLNSSKHKPTGKIKSSI